MEASPLFSSYLVSAAPGDFCPLPEQTEPSFSGRKMVNATPMPWKCRWREPASSARGTAVPWGHNEMPVLGFSAPPCHPLSLQFLHEVAALRFPKLINSNKSTYSVQTVPSSHPSLSSSHLAATVNWFSASSCGCLCIDSNKCVCVYIYIYSHIVPFKS